MNSKLQFTLEEEEEEEDRMIHFLDITIFRHNNNVQFDIFRKPTATDVIIPYYSYHPDEQKSVPSVIYKTEMRPTQSLWRINRKKL
jgi:hypothetical protein